MAMIRCPICGEKYSDTYRDCPFCEEEEALRDGEEIRRSPRRGKRAAHGKSYNLITPTLIVLILIMAGLLVYLLYGDKLAAKFGGEEQTKNPPVEDVTPGAPVEAPDTQEPDDSQSGVMPEEPSGTDTPDTPDAPVTTEPDEQVNTDYEAAAKLPDGLSLSTTDFTLKNLGETHTIKVSGGSSSYQWYSQDDGIASVDQNGKVTAVSGGTINVLVTDGSKKAICIVRITASGSLPEAPTTSSGNSGSSGSYKLNKEDFTRSIREGSYQLSVSGVTTGITWKSSNTNVATVSGNGLVTPVGAGTATITASWNGQSLSCIVRVPG